MSKPKDMKPEDTKLGETNPGDTKPETTAVKTFAQVMAAIADDIAQLKTSYPQLADFDVSTHFNDTRLTVSYGYKTHKSTTRGGWTAAVPNPDDDGVWFHLDFHDPSSTAQIHTQPMVEKLSFRDKTVMLLILEGAKTKKLAAALRGILTKHGVTGR